MGEGNNNNVAYNSRGQPQVGGVIRWAVEVGSVGMFLAMVVVIIVGRGGMCCY